MEIIVHKQHAEKKKQMGRKGKDFTRLISPDTDIYY